MPWKEWLLMLLRREFVELVLAQYFRMPVRRFGKTLGFNHPTDS
jgi:hypothetical protein